MAQAQMSPDAKFVVKTEDWGLLHAYLIDGDRTSHIAQQPHGSDPEQFHWLVRSAAAFHKVLPVEVQ